ncbi:class I SAM-dependent methyltransferase [Aquimarina mytili]|uniref:Class I SAM-dependent methyltransferase n=1 Tax=Aquimarina mytili TaxID=874423 RepID=A0A937DAA4_9FLAO|nr:class I SAM-dependent methyltransferase [Aquimarina mytili]MBL0685825.1 class I SAM-dependent methyltransferase [Aquimarina mytili]
MKLKSKALIFLLVLITVEESYTQYKENDWADRDTWMNVSRIFELAGITSGSKVADVGCHEGYLTIHLAKRVGESGNIYAVDVREDRLEKLKRHVKHRKLTNVKTIVGDYDDPKLPEETLDAVIVMDTYHEIDEYLTVLAHIKASLKTQGRIIIIEKFKIHMRNTSREEQMEAHTLSHTYVKSELQDAGFLITKEITDFGKWENDPDKTIWLLIGELQ